MGNRCLITQCKLNTKGELKAKQFYLNWNGSWDSVNPLLTIGKEYKFSFEKLYKIVRNTFGACEYKVFNAKEHYWDLIAPFDINGNYIIDECFNLKYYTGEGFRENEKYSFNKMINFIQKKNNLKLNVIENEFSKKYPSSEDKANFLATQTLCFEEFVALFNI